MKADGAGSASGTGSAGGAGSAGGTGSAGSIKEHVQGPISAGNSARAAAPKRRLLRGLRPLFQPTLQRRVILALALAFLLVWTALLLDSYIEFKRGMAVNPGLLGLGKGLMAQIADTADPARAATQVADAQSLFNRLRRDSGMLPGELLFQLYDARGQRLHPANASLELQGDATRPIEATLGGQDYWVVRLDSPRWSLRLAEPRPPDATVLGWMNRELWPSLLIAFPIVMGVVWIAVRRGLLPLRQLAARMAQRNPQDLSPLDLQPRHAELQPLAAALEDLLAQLRGKLQRERRFVQDAAHELRTPMAVISAQAHVVAHAADDSQRQAAQQALQHAIARASHLSGQLLALAALDEAATPEPAELDLAQLLREMLAQATPQALARRIELSLDAPERLAMRCDTSALHSVLQNLLDNALRYVQDGARIALDLGTSGHSVLITVADDGPGIAPEDRERLFERFQRGAGNRSPGSGLGLAIVRQALLRLRGDLHLQAGLDGKGIAFVVKLPRS